jgi:hypothetical protein
MLISCLSPKVFPHRSDPTQRSAHSVDYVYMTPGDRAQYKSLTPKHPRAAPSSVVARGHKPVLPFSHPRRRPRDLKSLNTRALSSISHLPHAFGNLTLAIRASMYHDPI